MADFPENVIPFTLARQVLEGFIPLAEDREGTGNLIRKLWQGHLATPAAGELTRLYNDQAAPDDLISEPVSRIAASMVLNGLIDSLHGLRMAILKNEELRYDVNLKDLQDLETYLYVAGSYVTQTYDDDGAEKYYPPELIIEATMNQQRNAPLIGDKGIIRPRNPNMN